MTTYNLNCFLANNNGQTGGVWTYGNLTLNPPTSWDEGAVISGGQVDISDFPDGRSYPFVYTINQGQSCEASTTYILQTATKFTISSLPAKQICVVNGVITGNTVTVNVTASGAYTWTAVSNNPSNFIITPSTGNGSGTGTFNFSITTPNPSTISNPFVGNITVSITPNTTLNTPGLSCITYSPSNLNPCGDVKDFTATFNSNISAGSTKSSSLCTNSLTVSSFDSFFNGTKIVPTGYTETYYINSSNTAAVLPYTFSATPTSQTIKRRVSNGICTAEVTSNLTVTAASSSGITNSQTICNN